MSKTTPKRGYPYPESTDPDDVPADMRALAEALDGDISAIKSSADETGAAVANLGFARIETGRFTQRFNRSVHYSHIVSFSKPFTSPPIVIVNKTTGASGTLNALVSPISITTTGFTIWSYSVTGQALENVSVTSNWVAIGS